MSGAGPAPVPLVELARDSWRLGFGAMRAMPNLFGGTFALMLAFNLAFRWAHPIGGGRDGADVALLGFARDVALDVITTGALLAVHRSVLLGEGADRPVWRLPPHYDRYLLWLVLLDLAGLPAALVVAWAAGRADVGAVAGAGADGVGQAAAGYWLLSGGSIWLTVRLGLLPPLLAMGTPGAGLRMAWDAARGHAGRMLGAALLTFVPLWFALVQVAALLRGLDGAAGPVLLAAWEAVAVLVIAAVTAALLSRLLQVHGGALGRRPVWT